MSNVIKKLSVGVLALVWVASATSAPHRTGAKPAPLASPVAAEAVSRVAPQVLASKTWPQTVKLFVLKVEFQPDVDPSTTGSGQWSDPEYAHNGDADYWVNKNFNGSSPDIVDYFDEVSYGQLTLQVQVSSLHTLPKTMTGYADTGAGLQALIADAKAVASVELGVATYDALMIVHAGVGEETDIANDTPGDIWSAYVNGTHEATVVPQTGTQDCGTQAQGFVGTCPANTGNAALNAQIDSFATVDTLGVSVHEFGHWLDLPDLYNTQTGGEGIGDWGVMATGLYGGYDPNAGSFAGSSPAHLSAWSKAFMGWLTPSQPATTPDPGAMTLSPINEPGISAATASQRLLKLQASFGNSAQYFLLENRSKSGFDSYLPGEGMLIWSIDSDIAEDPFVLNFNQVNVVPPGVRVLEADGDNALLRADNDFGSDGDPFPGSSLNTEITPSTTPSTQPYDVDGWVSLRSIARNAGSGDVVFELGYGPSKPVLQSTELSCVNTTEVTVTWNAVADADLDRYNLYRDGVLVTQTPGLSAFDPNGSVNALYQVSGVDVGGNEGSKSLGMIPSNLHCKWGGGGGVLFGIGRISGTHPVELVWLLFMVSAGLFRLRSFASS